jgi:hypothetical protein
MRKQNVNWKTFKLSHNKRQQFKNTKDKIYPEKSGESEGIYYDYQDNPDHDQGNQS